MFSVVLLDLDGVIRHFDPQHVVDVERQHGLEPGALQAAGFAKDLIEPAVTGVITREEWTRRIGVAVGNPQAAQEWLAARGEVDDAMLDVVDQLRAHGTTVAVLTNGTDTVDTELADFGITNRFDAVFSTADIGFAKPDRRAFLHVCDALGVEPQNVFFTDDSASKLAGAIEIGMTASIFVDLTTLRSELAEHRLLPAGEI